MEDDSTIKNACSKFMDMFKSIDFNISKKNKREQNLDLLLDSVSHVKKMIAAQKRVLSKAHKEYKAGKMSREELIDHEFRLFELEDELKKIQDDGTIDNELI